jgi:uncharacterized membrane protein YbhN (UPF0104 family)
VKKNKALTLLVRAGVSAVVIIYLFRSASVSDTVQTVLRTDRMVWISGILIYIFGQIISAYKWKVLSRAAGFHRPLQDHAAFYFIGMFFNLFLPTSIGGDAVKSYYLSRHDPGGRTAPAIYTVLAERFTGFVVMFWIGAAALLLSPSEVIHPTVKIFAAACSVLGTVFTLFFPSLVGAFKQRAWAQAMLRDIAVYWRSPAVIVRALIWSLIFHFLVTVVHIIIGKSMGLAVPLHYYFIAYPAASLAGFIPVSFNGIGPREGTYIYLFSLVGISRPDALAFGIIWLGIMICASLPGAVLYVQAGGGATHGRGARSARSGELHMTASTGHDAERRDVNAEIRQ